MFKINGLEPGGSGWVIGFSTVQGKTYRLESSSSLQGGSWITAREQIPGTGGIVELTDSSDDAASRKFYRAFVEP